MCMLMCVSVSLNLLLRLSCLFVTSGQGGVTVCSECESVFAYSVQVYCPLPVFAWPVHNCIGHNAPICQMNSFSCDSMWDSQCVDVFIEHEVTQHHTLHCGHHTLYAVIHVSASEVIKSLLSLSVQQLWDDLHSLGHAWQVFLVSTD